MRLSPQILAALALADTPKPSAIDPEPVLLYGPPAPLPEAHPDLYGQSGADRMPPGDNFGYDLAPKVKRPSTPPLGFGWNQGMQNEERVKQYLGIKDPPLSSRPVATDYDLMPPGDNFEYDLQPAQGVSSSARPEELKALDKQLAAQVQEGKPSTDPGELVPPGFEGYSPKRSAFEQAITYLGAAMSGGRSSELFNKDREYRRAALQLKRDQLGRQQRDKEQGRDLSAKAAAAKLPRKLPAEMVQRLVSLNQSVDEFEELIKDKKKYDTGPIADRVEKVLSAIGAGDYFGLAEKSEFKARIVRLLQSFIKSTEGGRSSDEDRRQLKKAMPDPGDNDGEFMSKARGMLKHVRSMRDRLRSQLGIEGGGGGGAKMIRVKIRDPSSGKVKLVPQSQVQMVLDRGGEIVE